MHHYARLTKRDLRALRRGRLGAIEIDVDGEEGAFGDDQEKGLLSGLYTLSDDGSIRTGESGARVEIDRTGIRLYDASDAVVVEMDTATGSGRFEGLVEGSEFWAPQKASGATRLALTPFFGGEMGMFWVLGGLTDTPSKTNSQAYLVTLVDDVGTMTGNLLQLVSRKSTTAYGQIELESGNGASTAYCRMKAKQGTTDTEIEMDALGEIRFKVNNATQLVSAVKGDLAVTATSDPNWGVRATCDGAGFTGPVFQARWSRGSTSALSALRALADYDGTPDLEFDLQGNGDGKCDGTWTGGGADYAEMFETVDGRPIPAGVPVAFEGAKVRRARAGDTDVAIVSTAPSVIGNDPLNWPKKYERDELGREVRDEAGDRRLSREYEAGKPYVPRSQRPEWVPVALLGQVPALDDGTCRVNGYATVGTDGRLTAGASGWRVLERTGANVVVVLVR